MGPDRRRERDCHETGFKGLSDAVRGNMAGNGRTAAIAANAAGARMRAWRTDAAGTQPANGRIGRAGGGRTRRPCERCASGRACGPPGRAGTQPPSHAATRPLPAGTPLISP